MISTRDLSELPDIEGLLKLHQSLATLDAILCPEWEFRYFSFNVHWDEGERLALMRNGEGDDWLVLFNRHGAVLKGYAHGSAMARKSPWPGLFEGVPKELGSFLDEAAFSPDKSTFCIWRRPGEAGWQRGRFDLPAGEDPDGSAGLLHFLDGRPATYKRWADEYFGNPINLPAIERIYRHVPLNPGLVSALNPELDYAELIDEIGEIGYPVGGV